MQHGDRKINCQRKSGQKKIYLTPSSGQIVFADIFTRFAENFDIRWLLDEPARERIDILGFDRGRTKKHDRTDTVVILEILNGRHIQHSLVATEKKHKKSGWGMAMTVEKLVQPANLYVHSHCLFFQLSVPFLGYICTVRYCWAAYDKVDRGRRERVPR